LPSFVNTRVAGDLRPGAILAPLDMKKVKPLSQDRQNPDKPYKRRQAGMMKSATLALIVRIENGKTSIVEALSDDREIQLFESEMKDLGIAALERVHAQRAQSQKEEEEFGDYVEELLSQPFVRPEIREHGVQWLQSKMRIEQYQRSEADAARVIAEYAFKMFEEDRSRRDFFLAGPTNRVRVKVLLVEQENPASRAA
jgi:hypothetical protein